MIEPFGGRSGEVAIGVVTWLVLLAAVRPSSSSERAQVAAVVLIASAGEVLGSLILGLYEYRRGGIPAFVPPGHGLVYLAGLRLSQTPQVRAHAAMVVRVAIAAAAGWTAGGLAFGPLPDVAGALAAAALLAFLLRGREPTLFACMLFFVAVLELYGTAMGTWQWAAHWPGLHIPQANPPSGVAAGYCVFDALALRLGPRLRRRPLHSPGWARSSMVRAADSQSQRVRCPPVPEPSSEALVGSRWRRNRRVGRQFGSWREHRVKPCRSLRRRLDRRQEVRVDLRGRDARVPHELLHLAQVLVDRRGQGAVRVAKVMKGQRLVPRTRARELGCVPRRLEAADRPVVAQRLANVIAEHVVVVAREVLTVAQACERHRCLVPQRDGSRLSLRLSHGSSAATGSTSASRCVSSERLNRTYGLRSGDTNACSHAAVQGYDPDQRLGGLGPVVVAPHGGRAAHHSE
jgi:hypothetical protein